MSSISRGARKKSFKKWKKTSCIDYKKGSVMIVEDSEDVNKVAECFPPVPLGKLENDKVYQHTIMFGSYFYLTHIW